MRLYEYEVKSIFANEGVPCQAGHLIRSKDEIEPALKKVSFPAVLKAQVLTGGRGKAGGIIMVDSYEAAPAQAASLFDKKIRGFDVNSILVEQKIDIAEEFYLGLAIDRTLYKITLMASASGGVDIEEAAQNDPGSVIRCDLDVDQKFYGFLGVSLAGAVGLKGKTLKSFAAVAGKLVDIFKSHDAKLLEINPLVLTSSGDLLAADARMSVDDDALFRQKNLGPLKLENRHEEGELTEREMQARAMGIPYLDLDGDIGMFPGGAGFGIMGNDFIVHYGGRPANFMDSGGGPAPERIANMLVLLDENPKVKAIFGARFGGISRCDDFARGVVMFLKNHGLSKPMVMRMTGNMWREGLEIFKKEKQARPDLFENIEIHGIETPIEEIAEKVVEITGTINS